MTTWYCPHCAMPIGSWVTAPRARRCEFCSLVIGEGRATVRPAAEAGERAHSSAAGVVRGRAANGEGVILDREATLAALTDVARELGCRSLGRLRMLDYVVRAEADESLPSVADVLVTFGGWKAATRMSPQANVRLDRAAA